MISTTLKVVSSVSLGFATVTVWPAMPRACAQAYKAVPEFGHSVYVCATSSWTKALPTLSVGAAAESKPRPTQANRVLPLVRVDMAGVDSDEDDTPSRLNSSRALAPLEQVQEQGQEQQVQVQEQVQ